MNVFAAVKKWSMGVAAAAVLGVSAGTVVGATQVARSPWLSVDRAHKTATVRIVAGYNGNNGGFNFDGYSAGAMTVTVPVGWTIDVVFRNDSKIPHSVLVAPYAKRDRVVAGNLEDIRWMSDFDKNLRLLDDHGGIGGETHGN